MKAFFQPKSSFDSTKLKANLRMAVTRLNMQKNKLVNSVKVQRRGIAELLAIEKYDSARIRVENCIREDVSIEGLEVLSLFLDLLSNRVQLLAESKPIRTAAGDKDPSSACPPELKEAVTSVIWASGRIGDTVPELRSIRKALEVKFGKTFVEMSLSNAEFSVNQRMIERLGTNAPPNDKCIAYLTNVALEFALEHYDAKRLSDQNGVMAPTVAANSLANVGLLTMNSHPGTLRTPSGLCIPPLTHPRDALDERLLRLKCV